MNKILCYIILLSIYTFRYFTQFILTGSVRAVPETCDELADMITAMATATSVKERLSIVKDILQTSITKCTDSSKLLTVGSSSSTLILANIFLLLLLG